MQPVNNYSSGLAKIGFASFMAFSASVGNAPAGGMAAPLLPNTAVVESAGGVPQRSGRRLEFPHHSVHLTVDADGWIRLPEEVYVGAEARSMTLQTNLFHLARKSVFVKPPDLPASAETNIPGIADLRMYAMHSAELNIAFLGDTDWYSKGSQIWKTFLPSSEIQKKIVGFRGLPSDWDGNDAYPISDIAIDEASRMVLIANLLLGSPDQLAIDSVPTPDGGVLLEWRGQRARVQARVHSNGEVTGFVATMSGGRTVSRHRLGTTSALNVVRIVGSTFGE